MIHRIKECHKNPEANNINFGIMRSTYDHPLVDYVVSAFRSISKTLPEIQMIDWEFTTDVDEVNQGKYERTRSNRRTDIEQQYTYITESWLGELTMNFAVDTTGYPFEIKDPTWYYTVRLLVPIADENGIQLIKGMRYIPQYQIVETTTYNTSNMVVAKALMGINMKKETIEVRDHRDNLYVLPLFKTNMFNGMVNAALMVLATMGWEDTLIFFSLDKFMDVVETDEFDPEYLYFRANDGLYLKVLKSVFPNHYIQEMTGTLLGALGTKMTLEEIRTIEAWEARLGSTKRNSLKESHRDLGARYKILFNRMYDETTHDRYPLTEYNKRAVFNIIRWMIQNYSELRSKDNLDLNNKCLRRSSYIASFVNGDISEKIKKFVNTTVNMEKKLRKKFDNFFSFNGSEIISKMHKSGLVKYDDLVNDMDFFQRFKVTTKGPNAIGNKNARNVSSQMRALHPSHIGILGLDYCSASEPGLTNYLNPLCETNGLRFKDAPAEPEGFNYQFYQDMGLILDDDNSPIIFTDPVKFNEVLDVIEDMHICHIGKPTTGVSVS